MNTDKGQSTFTLEERTDLRDRMVRFKADSGRTWKQIATKAGINSSTLSALCSDGMNLLTYSDEQFGKLHRWFLMAETQAMLEDQAAIVPAFQMTVTARRIHNMANWARRGKICAFAGDPGVGKTAGIDQYVAATPNCWKITGSPSVSTLTATLTALVAAINPMSRRAGGPPMYASRLVRQLVVGKQGVIFADEAQFFSTSALEELRAIHDETKVGLVLSGNREVLSKIEGRTRSAEFAQFSRRLGIVHIFATPEQADIDVILQAWGIESARERKFLSAIAMKPGGGAIGQMTQVLELATITANGAEEDLCLTHLEEAAAQLRTMPGAVA